MGFFIACIVLGVLLIGVAVNKDEISELGIIAKIAIFSLIVGCTGVIGGNFFSELYVLSLLSGAALILCILIKALTLIFGCELGFTTSLIVFLIFCGIVFELLARSNNMLGLGTDYVLIMIGLRNIAIILTLIVIFIKSFKMIFFKKNTDTYEVE